MSEPISPAVAGEGSAVSPAPSEDLSDLKAHMKAVDNIIEALSPLSPSGRHRVWRWVSDWLNQSAAPSHQGIHVPVPRPMPVDHRSGDPAAPAGIAQARTVKDQFTSLPELFSAARPSTDAEKALVVAAWLQEQAGDGDIDTQTVNRELNHLGHRVLNITRAFDALRARRPNLVVQTKKEGSTKQARKRLKVTIAGKQEVQRLLRDADQEA